MTSTRIVHNVLRLGESHIQLIALYCSPATGQQAALFNQQLMDVALAQARLIPLPLVIMGDLNATPDA
jgi:endonuclease/exonuclease/phosphatase family metal-dependent hydrolase